MIARPPVWRETTTAIWIGRLALNFAALVVGALALVVALAGVAALVGRVPAPAVGVVALGAAAAAAGLIGLPSPRWRVPRGLAAAGDTAYAVLFGLVLGAGLFTAVPSAGLYILITWGLTADWAETWPVFVLFAIGRFVPLAVAAVRSGSADVKSTAWRFRVGRRSLRYAELAVFVAVATVVLA